MVVGLWLSFSGEDLQSFERLSGLRILSVIVLVGNDAFSRHVSEVVSKSPRLSTLHLVGEADWSDTWRCLQIYEVHLEEITAAAVTDGLLQYLASYSGLQRLSLPRAGLNTGADSGQISAMFFDVLLEHATALSHCSRAAEYQGGWCFGSRNRQAISRLQHLTTLEMRVNASI